MKFSLNFIQEFLKVNVAPQKLASLLTMSGMEVEHLQEQGKDWIFDVEVTSNRYDWLSILGIAREIAAILDKSLKVDYPAIRKGTSLAGKDIIIENIKDCPYYVGKLIKDVKVNESSQWVKERILNCGIASINNIVDITNYSMLKWGNPLHAFDADKIEGNIYIRRAKKNESFVGIDSKARELTKDSLVIADNEKVIALAGVMGAKNTEVGENTKNIFLEAAIFSPLTVRRSRRAAGLDTESSYRFERAASGTALEYTLAEAVKLIEKLAKGILSGYKTAGKKPHMPSKKIIVDLKGLNSYLGEPFSKQNLKRILKRLGFSIKDVSGNKVVVSSLDWRSDIKSEVDIYEEFSRIYGYEKIKPKIPFLNCSWENTLSSYKSKSSYYFKNKLRAYISTLNFKEIITYSIEPALPSGRDEAGLKEFQEKTIVRIVNPLKKQESCLRLSLLQGMLKIIKYNLNRNQSNLCFFEIANVYFKNRKGFVETPALSLGAIGKLENFFYLKGVVENILAYLNIYNCEFKRGPLKNFTNALSISVNGKVLGFLGKLDESTKDTFGLKEDVFFSQLNLGLLKEKMASRKYKHFSFYPAIWRDVSILLENEIDFKEVERIIRKESSYLKKLAVIDFYKGKDVPLNSKAFTLRIFYQSKDRTLTSSEVDSFHNNIREVLSQKEGIALR